MGGRGANININKIVLRKNIKKSIALAVKSPVAVMRIPSINQEGIPNVTSRHIYQREISVRKIGTIPDFIVDRYQQITGNIITNVILRPADRNAHIITHHGIKILNIIKRYRNSIYKHPDVVYMNNDARRSLIFGKKINSIDYVIVVGTAGNTITPNMNVYEATGYKIEVGFVKKFEKKNGKYTKLYQRY